VPGIARPHLLKVDVVAVDQHLPQRPAVAVLLVVFDRHRPAEHSRAQVLLGSGPEGLLALGRIDTNEPNLVLLEPGVEQGQCVAISDRHHTAGQRVGNGFQRMRSVRRRRWSCRAWARS